LTAVGVVRPKVISAVDFRKRLATKRFFRAFGAPGIPMKKQGVAVLRENKFQKFFREKKEQGKLYRVALIATANKMARVIYGVWKSGQRYEEDFC